MQHRLTRRTRALATRSLHETEDELGPSAWAAVPAGLLVALVIIAANGFTWDWLALIAAIATYPALFAVAFTRRLLVNIRHPDKNANWKFEPTQVHGEPPAWTFVIRHKIGAPHVEEHRLVLHGPCGTTHVASSGPGQGHRFAFTYPHDFGDSALMPPEAAQWEAVWMIDGREILRRMEALPPA